VGAYGRVDAVKYNTGKNWGNKLYAKKTMEFTDLGEWGIPSNAIREVSLLKELDHPNIIKVEEVIYNMPKLHLIMEYMDTDLKKYLDKNKPLATSKIQFIMKQILEGVNAMHCSRVIHRDLKPENIFIDSEDHVKIGDFGISRTFGVSSKPMSPEVVTIFYRAPELALGMMEYSIPIDMWSWGCIFAELFTTSPIFKVKNDIDLLTTAFKALGTPTEDTWPGINDMISAVMPKYPQKSVSVGVPEADDLLNKLLVINPSERISAKEALLHSFFEVNFDE
jgi:serine/threonine protein kinase